MRHLSDYFFMEVVLNKIHNNVDKYATFNKAGDTILYTEKTNPKLKRTIDLDEGARIFEDLYGDASDRWIKSEEYVTLTLKKLINRKG